MEEEKKKIEIPLEHQLKCEGCGDILDMRDVSVIFHGWIEGDKIVCYTDEGEKFRDRFTSKKIGDNVEWTKDKKPINLN